MTLVLPQPLFDDPPVWRNHDYAVGLLNTAVQGRIVYALAATRPATGIVFEVKLADNDLYCVENDVAAGHTFGLRHSQLASDIMGAADMRYRHRHGTVPLRCCRCSSCSIGPRATCTRTTTGW